MLQSVKGLIRRIALSSILVIGLLRRPSLAPGRVLQTLGLPVPRRMKAM